MMKFCGFKGIEPSAWQITNTRDEVVTKEMGRREDHIADAASIGVMIFDFATCFVHQKPVQYIRCFAGRGGNVLRGEGVKLIADMQIGFETWRIAIFGICVTTLLPIEPA